MYWLRIGTGGITVTQDSAVCMSGLNACGMVSLINSTSFKAGQMTDPLMHMVQGQESAGCWLQRCWTATRSSLLAHMDGSDLVSMRNLGWLTT